MIIMKKVIATIDDSGNLTDNNGIVMVSTTGMNYDLPELDESKEGFSVAQLVSLGVTPDDLIKMKANGVI